MTAGALTTAAVDRRTRTHTAPTPSRLTAATATTATTTRSTTSLQSSRRVNSGRHSDSGGDDDADDAGGKHAGAGGDDDDEDGDHGDVTRAVSSRTASSGFRGRGPPSPELLKIVKRCMDSTNATPVLADTFTKSSKDDSKWIRFRWRQRYVVVGLGMFAWYAREGDVHSRGSRGLELLQRVERLEPADIGGKRFAFDVRLLGRGGEGGVWWLVQGVFVDVWMPLAALGHICACVRVCLCLGSCLGGRCGAWKGCAVWCICRCGLPAIVCGWVCVSCLVRCVGCQSQR